MTTTQPTDRLAVWYRRRASRAQNPEASTRLAEDRQQAEAIAKRAGVRIACEVEARGSASSPMALEAWESAKRKATALGATHVIVLAPREVSPHLPVYVSDRDELKANGVELLHEAGTDDWAAEQAQLYMDLICYFEAARAREGSERAKEVWRRRKAAQAKKAAA